MELAPLPAGVAGPLRRCRRAAGLSRSPRFPRPAPVSRLSHRCRSAASAGGHCRARRCGRPVIGPAAAESQRARRVAVRVHATPESQPPGPGHPARRQARRRTWTHHGAGTRRGHRDVRAAHKHSAGQVWEGGSGHVRQTHRQSRLGAGRGAAARGLDIAPGPGGFEGRLGESR